MLQNEDMDESIIHATMSHGFGIVPLPHEPTHIMEKILFAVDELTGLIGAAALMRPSKSVSDMELSNVKKKFKDKKFATECSRDVIFVGAMRSGEVVGLTWDCIDLEKGGFRVNKWLQQVTLASLEALPKDDLIFVFSKCTSNAKSVLVLKKPKTDDSNRVNIITPQLKEDLLLRKRQIAKNKAYQGNEYHDYHLVFCFDDGRPVEPKRRAKWFQVWQERTGLDLNTIVFHGIRHSAAATFSI